MTCHICQGKKLKKIFSLGNQPFANKLIDTPKKVSLYPLDLYECQHCNLIQLGYVADKRDLYKNYFYVPSVSKTHVAHFNELSRNLVHKLKLKKKSLVLDIGSSDGSLLTCFEKRGMRVVGVEPAENIKSSVLTIRRFFNQNVARFIVRNYGKVKLATATNVLAHINNLHNFLFALNIALDDDGYFFAQFPDVRNLFSNNQFDTIYHEHLSYFTREPLYHLFANSPFEIVEMRNHKIHGGSMRILVKRKTNIIKNFVENVKIIRRDLVNYLHSEKKKGMKIVGFGAAAKGVVLLNYCNLNYKIIDYVADGTLYKQGKYIPGVNIPIVPESKLFDDRPDIILILAWNFKEEIMSKLKDFSCKFVVPIPKVEIIHK